MGSQQRSTTSCLLVGVSDERLGKSTISTLPVTQRNAFWMGRICLTRFFLCCEHIMMNAIVTESTVAADFMAFDSGVLFLFYYLLMKRKVPVF